MALKESHTSASSPFRRLPRLCPRFSLLEAEGATLDFELPRIVQAIFYAMLLNDVIELGVVHGFIANDLKSILIGLRWTFFEAWMSCTSHELMEAQLRQRPIAMEARGSLDGRDERSGSIGPPHPSSHKEQS